MQTISNAKPGKFLSMYDPAKGGSTGWDPNKKMKVGIKIDDEESEAEEFEEEQDDDDQRQRLAQDASAHLHGTMVKGKTNQSKSKDSAEFMGYDS